MPEYIVNKVNALRTEKNVTQEELAQKLQVSRQTIIAIEKGNYTPSVLLALKIADFFKLPVEKIFTISYENNISKEFVVSLLLVVLAILLLNPFHFWMPSIAVLCLLATALVVFGIFASFVLREKITDERDSFHRTLAGRNAFLVGAGIVLAGIIVQAYTHSVDSWLVVALIAMIVVKLYTRTWTDKNL